jgi:hypothetical protein
MLQRRLDTEAFVNDHNFTNTIQKSRRSSRQVALFRHLHSFFGPDSMPTARSNRDLQDIDLEALLEKLTLKTRADMDKFDCTEMTDGVQACYKVCSIPFQRSCRASYILLTCKQLALSPLLNDFRMSGFGEILRQNVPRLFICDVVDKLDDTVVEDVTGESDVAKADRQGWTKKLQVLEESLKRLQRLE